MSDSNSSKTGSRPSTPPSSAATPPGGAKPDAVGQQQPRGPQDMRTAGRTTAGVPGAALPAATPANDPDPLAGLSGRIVHDERGNAIWDWVKETSRIAIDSTSRLLKRLEVPELKVEEPQDDPLSLEAERDSGGGYDPYGSASPSKSFFGRAVGGSTTGPGAPGQGGKPSGTKRDVGGGYDPYGKGVTRKPGRK